MATLNTAPAQHASAREKRAPRKGAILFVLILAQLMIVLDVTVVNIALPSAQKALGFSTANRQWVVTGYSLAFGSLLLLGGKLSDLFGRRNTLMIGLVGFAIASAVGGAANGLAMLIMARVAQGAFGALLAPSVLSLLTTTFTDPVSRAKAFSIFGAVAGAGGAVGLLLGGVLTEYLSWRWCLYINLIMAVITVIGAILLLPRQSQAVSRPRIDLPGSISVTLGLVGIVYGLGHAESGGWSSLATVLPLIFGALLIVAFGVIENRITNPLLPLRVVLDRTRGGSYLIIGFAGAGMFAVFLFLTYFMSQILGYSPVMSGVGFMPMIISLTLVTVTLGPWLLERVGPRSMMTAGALVAAGGMFYLGLLSLGSSYWGGVLPGLVIVGAGMGVVFAPAINASTAGVRPEDAGVASAMVNVGQQIGGSIGTALVSTISASAATSYLVGKVPTAAVQAEAGLHAYTAAFNAGGVIFLVGAVVAALLLKGGKLGASPKGAGAGVHRRLTSPS
jgi:EmrB/QacA subfamily drug resistance transporter